MAPDWKAILSNGLLTTAAGAYCDPGYVIEDIDRGDGVPGTYVESTEADTRFGVQWGADGTQYTGALVVPSTPPHVEDVSPTSPCGLALVELRDALAASATWQAWCAVEDDLDPVASAKAHIRYYWRDQDDLEDDGEAVAGAWPHALVHLQGIKRVRIAEGVAPTYAGGMVLAMTLQGLVPTETVDAVEVLVTDDEAIIDHQNRAEVVFDEVLAGLTTVRPLVADKLSGPMITDAKSRVQYVSSTWYFAAGNPRALPNR